MIFGLLNSCCTCDLAGGVRVAQSVQFPYKATKHVQLQLAFAAKWLLQLESYSKGLQAAHK